jgi:putative lipoic acid-binding regulatory protein
MMASVNPPENGQDQQETLLEFPCKFPVKAMGLDDRGFKVLVTEIVLRHAEIYADEPVTTIPSSSGKYLSVTVTVEATSKAQLDRIYQDLTDCEQVLVAL